ncbi:hypothetical protein M0R04_05325 [Candidatus Dojkabacteria bacterium]|jgi:hypothetical protein|nr:hypothetical protein [Candidatus Dojkabacteria bacterium]
MTITTRTPSNPNFLQSNKFQVHFARCPNIQYFCQAIMVPGISLSEVPRTNPFVELYSPGEKAIYDILNITFIVDEDLLAWKEIHDWIRAMTFPNRFDEYKNLTNIARPTVREGFPQFSDANLTLLSAANQPIYMFKFIDVFPIAVSSFPMNAADSPDSILTADATFRYSYYDIESLI